MLVKNYCGISVEFPEGVSITFELPQPPPLSLLVIGANLADLKINMLTSFELFYVLAMGYCSSRLCSREKPVFYSLNHDCFLLLMAKINNAIKISCEELKFDGLLIIIKDTTYRISHRVMLNKNIYNMNSIFL